MDNPQATTHPPEARGPLLAALERNWTVAGDLAFAAYRVIARSGLALPTQRALAAESHMSTSAVSRNSGGGLPSMLAGAIAQARRRTWPRLGHGTTPLRGWLPETEGEVRDAGVWLAWLELARGHADVAPAIGEVARSERQVLAMDTRTSGLPEEPLVVAAVECLLAGLLARRCDPTDPIGHEEAVQVLDLVTDALRPAA
jgi:hypothetical protein